MKDKELKIKVDGQFIEKVDYLQKINDFKNRSDCVRKVVEKEWRKENTFPNLSIPVESGGMIMPIEKEKDIVKEINDYIKSIGMTTKEYVDAVYGRKEKDK